MSKKTSKKTVSSLVRVPLEFHYPEAKSVNIAGSFNDWDAVGLPMKATAQGRWALELDLPAGRYEFRLVVDGIWADVPGAAEAVENPFGSRNAVLVVALPR